MAEEEPLRIINIYTFLRLQVEEWEDGYVAILPGAPGIVGQGDSVSEATNDFRAALLFTLKAESEEGEDG